MSDSKSQNGKGDEPEQFRKIFIGGLSLATSDETLRDFYSKFGEILDSIVMKDGVTKKSRGFGFVTFSKKSEVDEAMRNRPHTIDGKTVDPKRAVPRDQSTRGEANVSTQRLYVSGVREEHTEEVFRDYFKEFGNVTKVEIIPDKQTGKPRGFGFITFDDYDPVDKCVLQKSHTIAGFRCDTKKALSRDEMARVQQKDMDRQMRGARTRGGPAATVAWQGPAGGRGPGPAGPYREPHSGGGYGAPAWGGVPNAQWQAPAQQGQWSGYSAPAAAAPYGGAAPQGQYGGGHYGGAAQGGGAWGAPAAAAPAPYGGTPWQGGGAPPAGGQSWGGAPRY